MPDALAMRIHSVGVWLPTIIELSMVGFKTSVAAAAADVIHFLSQNPSPQQVLDYYISDDHQARVSHLLELNAEGKATEVEQQELDEWGKFNHLTLLLKAQAGKQMRQQS
jgi:hypothetical protein